MQVYDPDLGPLEKRIQRSYLDAVNSDIVDLRESEYWFTTPEGEGGGMIWALGTWHGAQRALGFSMRCDAGCHDACKAKDNDNW